MFVSASAARGGGLESENWSWEGTGYGSRALMFLYFMLAIQLSFVRCAAISNSSTTPFHLNIHSTHIVVEFIVILSED
jgi:hypothetical protein